MFFLLRVNGRYIYVDNIIICRDYPDALECRLTKVSNFRKVTSIPDLFFFLTAKKQQNA